MTIDHSYVRTSPKYEQQLEQAIRTDVTRVLRKARPILWRLRKSGHQRYEIALCGGNKSLQQQICGDSRIASALTQDPDHIDQSALRKVIDRLNLQFGPQNVYIGYVEFPAPYQSIRNDVQRASYGLYMVSVLND